MGTPDFAVPTLRELHTNGLIPELVVTQPDRPKGRGKKLLAPPVKTVALELGCDVIQPATISDPGIKERLNAPRSGFLRGGCLWSYFTTRHSVHSARCPNQPSCVAASEISRGSADSTGAYEW